MLFLAILLLGTQTTAYAYKLTRVISEEYLDPSYNQGIFLVEKILIECRLYTFTHIEKDGERIIKMDGAEELTVKTEMITSTRSSRSNSERSNSDGWTNFGPEWRHIPIAANATTATAALALSLACGGPVGVFISVASLIAGVYTSIDAEISGRYKFEGNRVKGEYTAKLYPDGKYLTTVSWSGSR